MPDREKVIKGLECCTMMTTLEYPYRCKECPYQINGNPCERFTIMKDALELLKEQEAVEPHSHLTDDSDLYFTCGKCGRVIWSESYKFCPICATRIAWNGEGR